MKIRRFLMAALFLNLVLTVALVWLWRSRTPQPPATAHEEHPPMEGFTPAPEVDSAAPLTPVQLTAERMQSIGVRTGRAEYSNVGAEIRATGTIDVDERRLAYVQTRYPGWIRKVFVDSTYQYVKKGQPLFTIYSPELAASEQEYLLAKNNLTRLRQSSLKEVSSGAEQLLESARERLKQWSLSDSDIERLDSTGKSTSEFTFASPVSGYVLERMAVPNAYAQPEMKLYAVADLFGVWAYAQVFQEDAGRLAPGDSAEITVDAYPGRTFHARIEQLLPQVDPSTRTLRVRMAVPNPGLLLKPGMFVNITLHGPSTRQLVVPASAVLHSGVRDLVFLDRGNGLFEPRQVETGIRDGDRLAIRSGLKEGDLISTSANFLIDSEGQLQAAAGAFAPVPERSGDTKTSPAPSEVRVELTTVPDPPQKGRLQLRLRLQSADGKPIPGAKVNLRFFMPAMPAMGMAAVTLAADLEDMGGGSYAGQIDLAETGTWQVTVAAQQKDGTQVSKRLSLSVSGGM